MAMGSESNSSNALVRKGADTDLMPPPPPTKRIKRPKKVIDEDTYTDALSRIIARDFFPGLLESETQQEYLDALDSKDSAWISSASKRLQQVMTPRSRRPGSVTPAATPRPASETPRGYVGDTPASTVSAASTAAPDRIGVNTNMSLAMFQAEYTSEDNESFYKLLDKQNWKRAEKYAWLWRGNKLPSQMQLKQKEVEAKLSEGRGGLADDGFKKDRLAIRDKDDRPAAPDHWKAKPNNELMFAPDGVDGIYESVAERAQAESRAEQKAIVYQNTRAPVPTAAQESTLEESVPPSPSLSAVRDAISGRRRSAYQESSTGGGETPRVRGYAFVDDEEPETTASSTPVIDLGQGDATPNPFQLREQRKREALHHRMVERISQSKRSSAKLGLTGKVSKTPVPKFPSSPRVSGDLTPAAQRLWGKIDSAGRTASESPFSRPKATPARGKGSRLKNVTK